MLDYEPIAYPIMFPFPTTHLYALSNAYIKEDRITHQLHLSLLFHSTLMLWTDTQQPMYPLFTQDASMSPPNTTLLPSNDFKFAPQPTSLLYDPSSYYVSQQQQQQQPQAQTFITAATTAGSITSSSGTEDEDLTAISTPRRTSCTQSRKRKLNSTDDADDEKRKHFLERNRQGRIPDVCVVVRQYS